MGGFTNLPAIFDERQDGNLVIAPVNNNPIVLVIGTAAQGDSETLYRVDKISDAARAFGKTGTLARGLYEVSAAGALNIRLFRIGATAAQLVGVGKTPTLAGYTIETVQKDSTIGDEYRFAYDASDDRLQVWREDDQELVFDNNPSDPENVVDLGEVAVVGIAGNDPTYGDIGVLASGFSGGVVLSDADDEYGVGLGPDFTAGTDGLDLSRMEMYEALYNAYQLLGDQDVDVVVPMNVYLDDLNIVDIGQVEANGRSVGDIGGVGHTYPTANSRQDILGRLYVEEVSGVNYFWWWFPTDTDADVDTQFVTDGGANIWPAVAAASSLQAGDGSFLTGSDFHEVNFGYQLADFCFKQSRDSVDMTGVIGVLPPETFSLRDVSQWVGTLPTYVVDGSNTVVQTNGTGLLGNKWMSGRKANSGSGLLAHSVNGIAGLAQGGFIATDTGFVDGTQLLDNNDHLVDIGKYISVVATWCTLQNPSRTNAYTATGAPTYGGFYSTLAPESAPTNKVLRSIRLPFRVGTSKLDLLAGQRYVTFHAKPQGNVVSDAPVAARTDSDYQRLSTMMQVKACIDEVRRIGEPFLGESMSGARLAALDTAIDNVLRGLVKRGVIIRYEHQVSASPAQRVQGKATVELKIVPSFELRQITVVVALSAV